MRAVLVAGLGLAMVAAGCLAAPQATREAVLSPSQAPDQAPVVALVDSGINPYHAAFRAPAFELPPRIAEIRPVPLRLTFGSDWKQDYASDKDIWAHLERGKLYWFEGTRVVAISLAEPGNTTPVMDDVGHGTLTASTILLNERDAVIVMVSSGSEAKTLPPFFDPAYTENAIRWAANQSWIDVISLSLAMPGGIPIDGFKDIPGILHNATDAGKVVVAGVGNDGTPSLTNQIGGPPWVIKAGAADTQQHGETALASKLPDFVGDFWVRAACYRDVSALCEDGGTSFSTPTVAGAFARAIRELREATGHDGGIRDGALVDAGLRVTNRDLREAFNRTSLYWNTTDYGPAVPPAPSDLFTTVELPYRVAAPVLPAPWVQMGWGYANGSVGHSVAQNILLHRLPSKSDAAVAFMQAADEARQVYWQHPVAG